MTTNTPGPLDRVAAHAVREALLPPGELAELLAFTLANEALFGTTVLEGARIDTAYRASKALPREAFREWRHRLRAVLDPLVPELCRELGMAPFMLSGLEIELVRHNDGDFYRRHIDTLTAKPDEASRRTLSMVFYFHAEPKAYEGGALRLLPIKPGPAFVDVAPGQNRLVAFPSWVPHEVMPIFCPSGRFADSRFAVNCWAHAAPAAAQS